MKRALLLAFAGLAFVGCDKKPAEQSVVEMSDTESDSAEIARLEAEHPGLILDPTPAQVAGAIPTGNRVSPTTGETIDSTIAAIPVIYKGKLVNLACASCIAEFGSDPDHYLALAEANKGPEPE